jgi:cytochrome c-type biogenesis protein CcmH/NrfF
MRGWVRWGLPAALIGLLILLVLIANGARRRSRDNSRNKP